jgi:hypothetical protein
MFLKSVRVYIKAVDLRQAEHDVLLPLKWITTLDLDRQACELGYSAGDLTPACEIERGAAKGSEGGEYAITWMGVPYHSCGRVNCIWGGEVATDIGLSWQGCPQLP